MAAGRWWSGIVVVLAIGCSPEAAIPPPGELPEVPPGDVQFALDPQPVGVTGQLVGWNIGRGTLYGPANDPLHPQWRTSAREAAMAELAAARGPGGQPPMVRFSGLQIDGSLGGDGYHFWNYAEPGHVALPDDNMAPFQYMAIVEEIDAQPLVTLNFGSGTAAEAAEYVRHLVGEDASDPLVAARAHWGRDEPYRPVAYELGNEVYGFWNTGFSDVGAFAYANPQAEHGGDPPWHGRPAEDPADYAARAVEYIEAVLVEDPQARFWVPLSQAPMDAWEGLDVALPALEPLLLHPAVEAVAVHHYQVDDAKTLGYADMDAPMLAMAGTEVFRQPYAELRQRLDALRPELELAISEYHVAGAFTLGGFDAVADTHRVGLGLADIMIFFAQIGVDYAQQHMALDFSGEAADEMLFETWYNPLAERGGIVRARSSWMATRLVSEYLLAETAGLDSVAVETARYEGSSGPGFDYPVVHAVAFSEGDRASVVMLHRELSAARTVSIDLPAGEGWVVESIAAYAPPDVLVPIGEQDLGYVEPVWEQGVDRVRVTMPPHSLVGVRFSAGGGR